MKMTLPSGITLDSEEGLAPQLQAYGLRKGVVGVRAFIATDKHGRKQFLLVHGGTPVFSSVGYEAAAVRLDMIAADQQFPK